MGPVTVTHNGALAEPGQKAPTLHQSYPRSILEIYLTDPWPPPTSKHSSVQAQSRVLQQMSRMGM